jgi:virginiamycin A acetyltransferase
MHNWEMITLSMNDVSNPNVIFPIPNVKTVIYVKPKIKNKNIIVGEFTYFGDGVIIDANSVVGCNIEPYSIAVGNPAKVIKRRFDDELIALMLKLKCWDLPIAEINNLIPVLSGSDLDNVKIQLKNYVGGTY